LPFHYHLAFSYLAVATNTKRTIANHSEQTSHAHNSHSSEASIQGLSLNNGERWEMDSHTREVSLIMEKTFLNGNHSSQTELNALGTTLDAQMNKLIAGCTMKGEAHNQLHTFLNSHIPAIKNLAKATDFDEARDSAIKLKGNFETYKKHFK